MKTRKPTRTSARKTPKTAAKRTARKGAAAPAKRTARDGSRRASTSSRASTSTTVKRAAKKAVAKVAKAARTVKKAAAKKLGGVTGGGARKGVASRKLPAQADREHVHELLADFSTVMLVTSEGTGASMKLRARPMNVASLGEDSTLTFMTGLDTAKVDEARGGSVAHVVAQGSTIFVSLSGRAEVVRDRDRIEAAWKPADKVYFPKGKEDPNICLIVFHPEEAELWDVSGAKGLKFLFDAAKSLLTGEAPRKSADDTHDVVDLRAAQ